MANIFIVNDINKQIKDNENSTNKIDTTINKIISEIVNFEYEQEEDEN